MSFYEHCIHYITYESHSFLLKFRNTVHAEDVLRYNDEQYKSAAAFYIILKIIFKQTVRG